MKAPQWLTEEIAAIGVRLLEGKMPRLEAEAAIAAATRSHAGYCADAGVTDALRLFRKWVSEHASSGDLFQSALFPDLPAVMRVAPKRSIPVNDMTGEELDHAKNMLWARTENMINGAEESAKREQVAFARLYDKVRPLLSGELTVGDVLDGLMGQAGEA
jgi:hypothetical protein